VGAIDTYGRFIPEEGCFELTQEPPRKWVNLHYNQIGEHEIYAEITNIGDGHTWVRDGKGRTCVLAGYDAKYVYIRDDESGVVFCPWGAPAPKDVTDRACRYWAAMTEVRGTCEGLRAVHRVFVPRDYVMEVWTTTVENLADRPRTVSVFAYAMFQLTGCDEKGQWVGKDNYAEVLPEIGGTLVTNRNVFVPTDRFKGFLVALRDFRAGSGYRDHFTRSDFGLGTPRILWGWNGDNKPGYGPDCAGVVQVTLQIPARGTARADFLLGQTTGAEEVKKIRQGLTPEKIDRMCRDQAAAETERAGAFRVETGHGNIDALMNHFVKKQMYSYLINKSGFRDNLQLDNAYAMVEYPVARANFVRALASQFANGQVPHGFRPVNRLQYSDKPAWILFTAPGLVAESGDLALLEEVVPYFESAEKGTVWDHVLRAMRFLAGDLGPNGLCDQHHADWNDGLEAMPETGRRESVMVTQQLAYGLREVRALAEIRGDRAVAAEAGQLYETLARRLNDVAWDGRWYVRTLCEDGYRIGSHTNKEGYIFINSQVWAVLSGTAPADRAALCMDSLEKHLKTDLGYRLCAPPFSQYDPHIGHMSNSMPGHAENGGCYNHAAGFKAVADCVLGRAEAAWETFLKVAPDSPWNPVSVSEAEPFSFNNFYSTVPFVYGRSGYPWRTGTAGWFTVLLVEWILGARRHHKGLLIDPCLTRTIPRARVVRKFRGATYHIELDNSAGRSKGAASITVDGRHVQGNIIAPFAGGVHEVKVVI